MVVPLGEQMNEFGYSVNSFLFISDWEVVVESLCSLLEGAISSFNVISDSECFLDII